MGRLVPYEQQLGLASPSCIHQPSLFAPMTEKSCQELSVYKLGGQFSLREHGLQYPRDPTLNYLQFGVGTVLCALTF